MRPGVLALIIAALIAFVSAVGAQGAVGAHKDYYFTHIKSADGLPHQQVEAMAFDRMGRLWIGTRNGLACYDGYSFTNYCHIPGDTTSLSHNFVLRLLVDSNDNIWVGTEKGICRYLPATDNFKNYNVDGERVGRIVETADGSIVLGGSTLRILTPGSRTFRNMPRQDDGYIVGLAVSPENQVYVATNKSIAWYDQAIRTATFMDRDLYSDFLMGFDDIVPLFFDREGRMWIGRNGKGVMCLDRATGKRTIYDVPQLTNGTVRAIAQDNNGLIWVGTEIGLNVIDPATGHVDGLRQDLVNHHKLNDNAIYCIVPDRCGNIWIGTYFGGVNLLRNDYTRFHWIAPGYDSRSLRGKAVRRIVEPSPGTLWLATEDGGINIMDVATHHIDVFDRIPQLGINVHELYHDPLKHEVWIGSFRNGLFCYNTATGSVRQYMAGASGLGSNAVFSIVSQLRPDGERRLWIGTTHGLRWFDPDTDAFVPVNYPVLEYDFVYCMIVDSAGSLWVGTVNNGLFRIDGQTGEVQGWDISDEDETEGLRDRYITALYEDSVGNVLVGTNNGGLHVVERGSLKVRQFGDNPNELGTICSIVGDAAGKIWVSTSKGLFNIDLDSGHRRHFTVADGLPENQFNFASSLCASDGRLYFGTVNGLVAFQADVETPGGNPLEVHLWELFLNNGPVAPGSPASPLDEALDSTSELRLDYDASRTFSIAYGIVDPASASGASYQVFVDGIDKDWRDVGTQRNFTAMDFAPGTYRLLVRASSDDQGWNEAPVRELVIRISPPFYLSVWAFVVYVIVLLLLSLVVYRFAKVRISEKNAIRMSRIEKEKSDELNREKMEFFTNISHELKTPLSLILAPLKYISQHQQLSDDSTKRLGVAITNTNKMVGLIDELVTFNRVESGNFQLYLQQGNPLTFIETMCRYFYETAQEKNITIKIYTENNGEEVWFSTTYLERILNNLLSNAIKYTHEGGEIDVRASIEEGAGGEIFLCVEVRDNGIGIAPEEVGNIFRKYYQTKRGYNTNHQGWGIGLATVKRLVEIHKGSINVDTAVGEGSTFIVRLNVTPEAFDASCRITAAGSSEPEPSYRRAVSSGAASQPPIPEYARTADRTSILIVEDNTELLSFLTDTFARKYNVYTAANGREALKITAEYPIDIVVSDVMMPEMDGIALCEHLKNDLATSHIPVILLTAKNDEDSIMRGFEAGAEAYVAKPFDPQILELRVKNILRARSKFLNSIIESGGAAGPDSAAAAADAGEEAPAFNNFDKDFITRINALVEANLDNSEFAIADITREFGISRSLLHIKMKSFFNTSMTDYIRRKRMAAACRLLREGFNVSETAYRTGYSDPNYFTKVFKKEFGLTPSEFLATPQA
ncbi:MAG: response regulator [Muribaculaceae bacterium]|nr:response regulator [Muribaculaceae bacterium]